MSSGYAHRKLWPACAACNAAGCRCDAGLSPPVRVVEVGVLVERRLQLAAAVAPVVRRRRIAGRRTMDAEARFRPPLAVGRLRQLPLRRRLLVLLRLVRLRLVHLRLVRVPAVEAAVERRLQPLDVEARLRLLQTAVRLRRH